MVFVISLIYIYIYIYLIYKFLVIGDFNAEESARTSTIPTRL